MAWDRWGSFDGRATVQCRNDHSPHCTRVLAARVDTASVHEVCPPDQLCTAGSTGFRPQRIVVRRQLSVLSAAHPGVVCGRLKSQLQGVLS